HAGLDSVGVSSAFAVPYFVCWFCLPSAPTHHNHSLASGPIFGVLLISFKTKILIRVIREIRG
ncbi:MAG: hypothetical protein ACK6AY_05335, partial [Akkermansiaceae bacterium]